MQKLIDGVQTFQTSVFDSRRQMFEELAGGQKPVALFITCSDSRIDPNLITQTQPGELFVIRNAGNIVPEYGALCGGEAATIEYAVTALKVKDIIVCGHSFCGAMGGLLNPDQLEGLDAVKNWLTHAKATADVVSEKYAHLTGDGERLTAAVEENVLVQLDHLRTHPSVAEATARGDVNLHGWTYLFESGQVLAFSPEQNQFIPLESA